MCTAYSFGDARSGFSGDGVVDGTGTGEELPTLDDIVHRPAWMAQAQCRGEDRAIFFPERGASAVVATAKTICAGCPVGAECLEYAERLRRHAWHMGWDKCPGTAAAAHASC